MALQNIGASNSDDAFYRYKMPKMVTKIEGRGNGIKTNVVNMVDIAKALARPASYTTKYFGCELGAQSKFDEKTGTALVNGAHDTAKLAGLLENFIKKYVQCYGCGNPETEVVITKTQMLNLKCAACGFLSDVDMRDKLTTFILKNPPEQKRSSKDKKAMRRAEKERLKEGEAADEEMKKIKREAAAAAAAAGGGKKKVGSGGGSKTSSTKKKGSGSDEDHSPAHSQADENERGPVVDDDDDDVQWQTDTSLEAAKQRIQEQLSAVTADMVMLSTAEEEKKKPPPPAKKSSPEGNGHENNGGTATATSANPAKEIKEFLRKGPPPTTSQLQSFLGSLPGAREEVADGLLEALFGGVGKGFAKEAAKKKKYLAAVVTGGGESQGVLLGALESFCMRVSPEAAKEVALVLKNLYDDDVIEEEFVLKWYQRGLAGDNKASPIWKNVKPFVEWLQSAESESEEE